MIRTPMIKIRPINFHFNLDTDRDDVLDRNDCQWWNPRKQHITPSQETRKRLEKTNLYVTDDPMYLEEKGIIISSDEPGATKGIHHISSKEARKYAPQATKDIYATIKRYPSFLGKVEKSDSMVTYSSNAPKQKVPILGQQSSKIIGIKKSRVIVGTPEEQKETMKEYLKEQPKEIPLKKRKQLIEEEFDRQQPWTFEDDPTVQKKVIRTIAGTGFHELVHEQQDKKHEPSYFTVLEDISGSKTTEDTPWEQEARLESLKEMQKYEPSKQPTGRQISKILKLK